MKRVVMVAMTLCAVAAPAVAQVAQDGRSPARRPDAVSRLAEAVERRSGSPATGRSVDERGIAAEDPLVSSPVAPSSDQTIAESHGDVMTGPFDRPVALSVDHPMVHPDAGQTPAASQPRPPAPAPPLSELSPRRRGSMVGYIEDTVVSSKVRVRFDVGLHSHTPDRAEFFYAKCGCYRDLNPGDPAYDPDAAGPGPGIVTDLNFQQLYLQGEYAVGARFSVFAELPIRWLQPQAFVPSTGSFADQTGISDLRAGVRLALTDTDVQMLTAQVKTFLATGDGRTGLGTDHASIEPAILYYQQISQRAAVESQFSIWLPIGGSDGVPVSASDKFAGSVIAYGIGPSFELYRSAQLRFAPVVELVGWHVLSGFQTSATGDASGTNVVNLKFGARASWGNGGSIYVGYGRALTDADWYNDIVRAEYRFSF